MSQTNSYFVYFVAISVNLMSFVCGTSNVWTSPFLPVLNNETNLEGNPLQRPTTPLEDSLIISLFFFGGVCSPLIIGPMANRFGKKRVLLMFMLFPVISNIMMAYGQHVAYFFIARFLLGFATGCVFSLIPIYVAEISDVENRGSTSIIIALMILFSQLLVFLIGPYVSIKTFSLIYLVPSLLFIICFGLFAPESSHHLIFHNQIEEAKKSLKRLRGKSDVEKDVMEISLEIQEINKPITFSVVTSEKVKRSVVITLGLLFFQQFSGILPIQANLQTIFSQADGFIPADKSAMLAGAFSFIVTVLFLRAVNVFGRKTLLIVSYVGIFFSLVVLALYFQLQQDGYDVRSFSWLPIVGILSYLAFFCIGAGPLPWTLIGEIFPSNLKAYLSSLAVSFVFLVSSFLAMSFPFISRILGPASLFWIYSGFVAIATIFIIYYVPETRGKTFQQIQIILEKKV